MFSIEYISSAVCEWWQRIKMKMCTIHRHVVVVVVVIVLYRRAHRLLHYFCFGRSYFQSTCNEQERVCPFYAKNLHTAVQQPRVCFVVSPHAFLQFPKRCHHESVRVQTLRSEREGGRKSIVASFEHECVNETSEDTQRFRFFFNKPKCGGIRRNMQLHFFDLCHIEIICVKN